MCIFLESWWVCATRKPERSPVSKTVVVLSKYMLGLLTKGPRCIFQGDIFPCSWAVCDSSIACFPCYLPVVLRLFSHLHYLLSYTMDDIYSISLGYVQISDLDCLVGSDPSLRLQERSHFVNKTSVTCFCLIIIVIALPFTIFCDADHWKHF